MGAANVLVWLIFLTLVPCRAELGRFMVFDNKGVLPPILTLSLLLPDDTSVCFGFVPGVKFFSGKI
jgi:hypothetical protein